MYIKFNRSLFGEQLILLLQENDRNYSHFSSPPKDQTHKQASLIIAMLVVMIVMIIIYTALIRYLIRKLGPFLSDKLIEDEFHKWKRFDSNAAFKGLGQVMINHNQ